MKRLYHVADPEFWKLWRKHGSAASVRKMPCVGGKRLDIELESIGKAELTGGYITAVELVRNESQTEVKVTMTSAPHPFTVVVYDYSDFGSMDDGVEITVTDRVREDRSKLTVRYVYRWNRPHVMLIAIHELPAASRTMFGPSSAGHLSIEKLRKKLDSGFQTGRYRDGSRPGLAIPVTDLSPFFGEVQSIGTLVLPPEVCISDLKRAAEDLFRFAEFAVKPAPKPAKKRRRAA